MKRDEPIWVTGIGTANPLGNDYAAVAGNLLAGRSGVRPSLILISMSNPAKSPVNLVH